MNYLRNPLDPQLFSHTAVQDLTALIPRNPPHGSGTPLNGTTTIETRILDVAEAVLELLLCLQDKDVIQIIFTRELAVRDLGGSAKPVVQAIWALLKDRAYVLNLLDAVDGASELGLVELALSIVLEQVAHGLAVVTLFEQSNVNVSD